MLREQAEFEGCLTRIKFDRLNFMDARANSIRLSIKRTPSSRCSKINHYAFRPRNSALLYRNKIWRHIIAYVICSCRQNSTFQRRNPWFMSEISYFGETLKSGLQALWISNSSAASGIIRLALRNLWALRGYNFRFWQNFKSDLQARKINLQSQKLVNLHFTATQKPRALKRIQDKYRACFGRFGASVKQKSRLLASSNLRYV